MNQLPSAVFLDRDGTIIEDVSYIADPDDVRLLPGAAEAIARANAALVPVMVVTNQSGIGRGYLSIGDHARVSSRMADELATFGAHIDATYYCPHTPDDACECRKPGTLLYRRAAEDREDLDLTRALYIGDRFRDVEPGLVLGGQGVLVPSEATPPGEIELAEERARVAPSLAVALDWYLCTN